MGIFYFFRLVWHRIFCATDKCCKSNVLWVFLISFDSFDIGYFVQPHKIACCMHFLPLWHTLDRAKTCFFHIPVFDRKSFLIFLIIYLRVGLRSHLHIHLSDLVNSLISADSCPGWHNDSLLVLLFSSFTVNWLLNFTE